MNYVLGLDVGIASVGWAVLNLDRERIEDLGVRAFSAAEEPKTKAPLAEACRLARGTRRRLRRRAGRLQAAKELFAANGLIDSSNIEAAFQTAPGKASPWELRAGGLDRLLTGEEMARALFHIVKRRGFKSNRKIDSADDKVKKDGAAKEDETRKALQGIEHNRQKLAEGGYRTAGEMYWKDPDFAERKRNNTNYYGRSVDRAMLDEEIGALFSAQRAKGSSFATTDLERELLDCFRFQKPFASGEQILSRVGTCTFEPEEKRAPKHCPTTERFVLLGHINRTVILDGSDERPLDARERAIAESEAYSLAKLSYAQLRKKLGLPEDARFKGLPYGKASRKKKKNAKAAAQSALPLATIEEPEADELACESAAFAQLTGYHGIRASLEAAGLWSHVKNDPDTQDHLAYATTFYKTDEDINAYLNSAGVSKEVIAAAANIPSFAKVGHLSLKALRKINPYLEQGMIYSDACAAAGYQHSDSTSGGQGRKLPVFDPNEIRNPVAIRALSQTRKVVNAIIDKYQGPPCRVHIELARDVGKSAEQRNAISKDIEENRAAKENDRKRFTEAFERPPNNEDELIKFRLYREQNGQCAYCARALDVQRLFDPGYAEIDHILPYSRSFDDSRNNRVVVMSACNQHKRNQTPYEWMGHDGERWAAFEAWTLANIRNLRKRTNLLTKEYAKRQQDWMERNLKDTQYIARYLATYIRENLKLADPADKAPVMCLNGKVVAMARGLWGIAKVRSENDLHHAADAAVIAAMTPALIQKVTRYHQALENRWVKTDVDYETGEVTEFLRGRKFTFPPPWLEFRREIKSRLSDDPAAAMAALGLQSYAEDPPALKPVMVSRAPRRKMTGAIHAETILAVKIVDGQQKGVVRKPLQTLKLADLDKLYGEDERLRAALRERLEQFLAQEKPDDSKREEKAAKKAFEGVFHKPGRGGRPGPQVRSVRIMESKPSGMEMRGGIADNGSIVRVDVFRKDGKYYLVPIYVSDVMARVLPNRAIAANKPESEWPVMDDRDFVFSLQPYDGVTIVTARHTITGYFRGLNRNTGALTLSAVNKNDELYGSLGPRNAIAVTKHQTSVLGEVQPVKREKRLGLANRSNNETREPSD